MALCLAGGTAAAAHGAWPAAALAVATAACVYGAVVAPEALLAVWFAASPWASYFLRFPDERSVVTFDRVAVLAAVVGLLARERRSGRRLPGPTTFEVAWACFAVTAALNALALSEQKALALRITADAFVLPLLLFYAVRAGFDAARGGRALFWGAVALGLSLPWTGLYEFVREVDVLAYEGSSIFRAGVVRANGPFTTDNSFALVSALVAVFLAWLPRELGLSVEGAAARGARRAAQLAALLAALVPIFRAVMLALGAAFALPYLVAGRVRTLARAAAVVLLVALAALPLLARVAGTRTFEERISDPSSAYSRLATYRAAVDVIGDHPIRGVGLVNYSSYFDAKYGTAWYVDVEEVGDVGAANYPHNNFLGTWAELGLLGIFFYALAAAALAVEAWRRSVAALALMIVYWVPGMTLQSGIYSDLNLYYFCMLAVLLGPGRRPVAGGRASEL
jgi:O-antigen ligase